MGEQGVETHLDVTGLRDPLPDAVARLLYRAAQEGLRNVVKHAHARTVRVTVATVGRRATLDVTDDGAGFDTAAISATAAGPLGLAALRGLVGDSGGDVEIRSERGAGTTLHVEMPL